MRRVFATLKALVEVMEALSKDAAPDGVGRLIMEEVLSSLLHSHLAYFHTLNTHQCVHTSLFLN